MKTLDPADARKLAVRVQDVGLAAINTFVQQPPPEEYRAVAMAVLARALTSLQSVVLLAEAGLTLDAMGAVRTICELDIDLAFILKEDPENRTALFLEHDEVLGLYQAKAFQALYKDDPTALSADAIQRLQERHDAAKGRYPDRYKWAGAIKGSESIKMRALAVDRENAYNLIYAEACRALHAGLSAIASHVEEVDTADGPVRRFLIGAGAPSGRPVTLACMCLMQMLDAVLEFLGYSDLAAQLHALVNEAAALGPD
ncbi:MAG: hypothetical protein IPL61_12145 [Myxococcales bacterium]|nr:hypothetical protein [Myxococcales bacterium]